MDIKIWLQEKISEESDMPISEISLDKAFQDFNMDSLSLLSLIFDLEATLGIEEMDPAILTENNTINKLSKWIQLQKK